MSSVIYDIEVLLSSICVTLPLAFFGEINATDTSSIDFRGCNFIYFFFLSTFDTSKITVGSPGVFSLEKSPVESGAKLPGSIRVPLKSFTE